MKIMSIGRKVKYNGEVYPAYTEFEVQDEHINELKRLGGWVISKENSVKQQSVEQSTTNEIKNAEPEQDKKPVKEEPNTSDTKDEKQAVIDELRSKATQLGIEWKGNWGIRKLSEAIKQIEEE